MEIISFGNNSAKINMFSLKTNFHRKINFALREVYGICEQYSCIAVLKSVKLI